MTTLPQTAPIRLPRTIPAGQLPGQLGPIATHAHPVFPTPLGNAPMAAADVWRVIRSNLWLIILMLAVFAGGGYATNRYILKPHFARYESTALLRVTPLSQLFRSQVAPTEMTEAVDIAVRQEAMTQAAMLKHDSLLIEVLNDQNSKVRETQWWQEFGNDVQKAKEDLADHFSAMPVQESRLIAVSMEYRVPDDCKTIVNEIVGKHLEKERRRKSDD